MYFPELEVFHGLKSVFHSILTDYYSNYSIFMNVHM